MLCCTLVSVKGVFVVACTTFGKIDFSDSASMFNFPFYLTSFIICVLDVVFFSS
jgi:hypothetical protein